jgi:hypothetical protein
VIDIFACEVGQKIKVEDEFYTLKCNTEGLWFLESSSSKITDFNGKHKMPKPDLQRILVEECYIIAGRKS